MRLLLHAASPSGLLTLLAATAAGVLPASSDRVIVFDSRTAAGRGVGEAIAAGLRLPASDTCLDLGPRADAAAVVRSLAPSVVVLDAAAAASAERLATTAGKARLVLLDDGGRAPSPTPSQLSRRTLERITDLVFAELIPGLRPVLLRERGDTLRRHPVPLPALREAAAAWAGAVAAPRRIQEWRSAGERTALVLGTELPELGPLAEAEAQRLAGRLVDAALDTGLRALAFLPGPGTGRADALRLAEAAAEAGLACAVLPTDLPAAVAHLLVAPALTLSVDEPWLLALRAHGGERVQSVATGRLLPRLASLRDARRPRLALTDAVLRRGVPLPEEQGDGAGDTLQQLLDAVAFAVAPERLSALRPSATRTLLHSPALRSAYVPTRLAKSLHLDEADAAPAAVTPSPRTPPGSGPQGTPRAGSPASPATPPAGRRGGPSRRGARGTAQDDAAPRSIPLPAHSTPRGVVGAAAGLAVGAASGLRRWWQRGSNA